MIVKLSRHGSSRALVIPKAILSLLKIDDNTEFELSTDGKMLILTRIRSLQESMEFSDKEYGKVFKRLASK